MNLIKEYHDNKRTGGVVEVAGPGAIDRPEGAGERVPVKGRDEIRSAVD